MAEFDLIPGDYRRGLHHLRWLRRFALALAIAAILSGSGFAALRLGTRAVSAEIDELRGTRAVNEQLGARLAELRKQRESYASQLSLLDGLRGGTPAERMFSVVDRALGEEPVWFARWRFERAGASVEVSPGGVNTGYFIVIPKADGSPEQRAWQVETHMSISGRALDHAALSRFAARLFEQPEIDDVRVLRTSLQAQRLKRVEFDLVVVVNNGAGR